MLLLMPVGSVAVAQFAGATLAKCTCNFDENGQPATNGAQAVNATLCVQMLDKGHKWCEITIACLRNNVGPQCGYSGTAQTALLPLYAFAIAQMPQTGDPALAFMEPRFKINQDAVAQLSYKNEDAIKNCVNSYYTHSKEDRRIPGEEFSCAFDHTTGWLAIAFNLGPQFVQFSFGPRE